MVSSPSGEKRVSTWENVKRKRGRATAAAAKEEEEKQRKVMLKCSKEKAEEPLVDIELQLQTPLPLEWQQCLDLKSGKIHFYNIRTHKRTNRDPRQNLEPTTSSSILSLDLELNFHKNSPQSSLGIHKREPPSLKDSNHRATTNGLSALQSSSSRLSPDEDYQEMVPIVCARCHMLVMLCKSTPTCPNCKFLHPSNLDPLKVFLSKSQPLAL